LNSPIVPSFAAATFALFGLMTLFSDFLPVQYIAPSRNKKKCIPPHFSYPPSHLNYFSLHYFYDHRAYSFPFVFVVSRCIIIIIIIPHSFPALFFWFLRNKHG